MTCVVNDGQTEEGGRLNRLRMAVSFILPPRSNNEYNPIAVIKEEAHDVSYHEGRCN